MKGKCHRMVIFGKSHYHIGHSHDYYHHSCRDRGSGTGLGRHQNGDAVLGRGQGSGTGLGFGHGWPQPEGKSSFAHEGRTQGAGQDRGHKYEQRPSGPMSVSEPHHENQKDSGDGSHGVWHIVPPVRQNIQRVILVLH